MSESSAILVNNSEQVDERLDSRWIREKVSYIWEQGFERRLQKLIRYQTWNAEDLLNLILYSAATRSAIYSPKSLMQLHTLLVSSGLFLKSAGSRTYFEVESTVHSGTYNKRVGAFSLRLERFSLDVLTCLLIYKFYELKHEILDCERVFDFPRTRDFFVGQHTDCKAISDLRDFCAIAPHLTSQYLSTKLSYNLRALRIGRLTNFPEDEVSFLNQYREPCSAHEVENNSEFTSRDFSVRSVDTTRPLSSRATSRLRRELMNVLNKDKTRTSSVIETLNSICNDPTKNLPTSIDLTLRWLAYKMSGKIIPETAANYLNDVFPALANVFGQDDIYELNAEELEVCVTKIFNFYPNDAEKAKRVKSHFSKIYVFGLDRYDLARNEPILKMINTQVKSDFVRTSTIDCRYYYAILRSLEENVIDNFERTQLKLITIIAFRCGLRIGEILKLQFRDIDPKSDWIGFVRANKNGRNKTRYSARQFWLRAFLSDNEFRLFKSYYRSQRSNRDTGNSLLFGQAGYNVKIPSRYISQTVGSIIKRVTRNDDAVFYSLRHSFATSMVAVAEDVPAVAERLTGFSVGKLKDIRRHFVPHRGRRRDMYKIIANLMGHASASETLRTYVHCVDELVYEQMNAASYSHNLAERLVMNSLNIRRGRLKRAAFDQILLRSIHKNKQVYVDRFDKQTAAPSVEPELNINWDLPYPVIESAWREVFRGNAIDSVADDFGLDPCWFRASHARVRALMLEKTLRGRYKFHDQEQNATLNKPPYKIPKAKSAQAHAISCGLNLKLRKMFLAGQKQQVLKWCEIVMNAFTFSHSTLKIDTPSDFRMLVAPLEDLLPRNGWSGYIEVAHGPGPEQVLCARSSARDWSKSTRRYINIKRPILKGVSRQVKKENGTLTLNVPHVDKIQTCGSKRQFGARVLTNAALLTYCILGALDETSVDTYSA